MIEYQFRVKNKAEFFAAVREAKRLGYIPFHDSDCYPDHYTVTYIDLWDDKEFTSSEEREKSSILLPLPLFKEYFKAIKPKQ